MFNSTLSLAWPLIGKLTKVLASFWPEIPELLITKAEKFEKTSALTQFQQTSPP